MRPFRVSIVDNDRDFVESLSISLEGNGGEKCVVDELCSISVDELLRQPFDPKELLEAVETQEINQRSKSHEGL